MRQIMNNVYLITFTPLDTFFFGGQVSFSDDYYVKSAQFPSPSTIMGALRASMLMKKGYLLQHKKGRFVPAEKSKAAADLTGITALDALDISQPDFGIIEQVSPCFLYQTTNNTCDAWFHLPNDIVKFKGSDFYQIVFDDLKGLASNCSKKQTSIPLRKQKHENTYVKAKEVQPGTFFGGKNFWTDYMANAKSVYYSNDIIDPSDYFTEHRQVGIGLAQRQAIDGALYVKHDYELHPNCCFAIIACFREEPAFTETIVMGGEQSIFRIHCEHIHENPLKGHPIIEAFIESSKTAQSKAEPTKQVAVSPLIANATFFENEIFSRCFINSTGAVRMLYSPTKHKDSKQNLKTDAWKMIPAGAVFFTTEPLPLNRGLADKIGYNKVLTC